MEAKSAALRGTKRAFSIPSNPVAFEMIVRKHSRTSDWSIHEKPNFTSFGRGLEKWMLVFVIRGAEMFANLSFIESKSTKLWQFFTLLLTNQWIWLFAKFVCGSLFVYATVTYVVCPDHFIDDFLEEFIVCYEMRCLRSIRSSEYVMAPLNFMSLFEGYYEIE